MKSVSPLAYFLGAIAVMAVCHFTIPLHRLVRFPWRLLGLLPLAAGILLNLLADRAFKRHDTTVKPFEESRALVTHGVFSLTRNPMYLGMISMLVGMALFMGSATPWLVVLLTALLLDHCFIRSEERMLAQAFGNQFHEYQRRVHRWI